MRVSSVRLMRASRVLLATLVLAGVQVSVALAQTAQDTTPKGAPLVMERTGRVMVPPAKYLTHRQRILSQPSMAKVTTGSPR